MPEDFNNSPDVQGFIHCELNLCGKYTPCYNVEIEQALLMFKGEDYFLCKIKCKRERFKSRVIFGKGIDLESQYMLNVAFGRNNAKTVNPKLSGLRQRLVVFYGNQNSQ